MCHLLKQQKLTVKSADLKLLQLFLGCRVKDICRVWVGSSSLRHLEPIIEVGVVVEELAPQSPSFLDSARTHHVEVTVFIVAGNFGFHELCWKYVTLKTWKCLQGRTGNSLTCTLLMKELCSCFLCKLLKNKLNSLLKTTKAFPQNESYSIQR